MRARRTAPTGLGRIPSAIGGGIQAPRRATAIAQGAKLGIEVIHDLIRVSAGPGMGVFTAAPKRDTILCETLAIRMAVRGTL